MKGNIRHLAISVPDKEKAAKFYEDCFGMTRQSESSIAARLSDGAISLTLLTFPTDEDAGDERGKDFVGLHHFGVWYDDMKAACTDVEAAGGTTKPIEGTIPMTGAELKYRDPDGIVFDVSVGGWHGAIKEQADASAAPPASPGGGRIRHIAVGVPDMEKAAAYCQKAYGFELVRKSSKRIYMSDGLVNYALMPDDDAPGLADGERFTGVHHFGILVDDVKAACAKMEAAGATAMSTASALDRPNAQGRYRDPYGIIVEVSAQNWEGAS
jgi:catechol 2,3-dioxygenase-like lactoylglutathione lyase family enzyme